MTAIALVKKSIKTMVGKKLYTQGGWAVRRAMYPFYWGNNVGCVMCGRRSRRFLPVGFDYPVLAEKNVIGGKKRLEAKCPYCGCDDRERLVFLMLKKWGVFQSSARILHVAPERQLQRHLENTPGLSYVTGDIESPFVDQKIDLTQCPFDSEYFDVVICNHVLEHIPNDRKAIAEIYRILKKGGWAILQVPISTSLSSTYEDAAIISAAQRARIFGQEDHVRIYASDYPGRLAAAGFDVNVQNVRELFSEEEIQTHRLISDEKVFHAKKPL